MVTVGMCRLILILIIEVFVWLGGTAVRKHVIYFKKVIDQSQFPLVLSILS